MKASATINFLGELGMLVTQKGRVGVRIEAISYLKRPRLACFDPKDPVSFIPVLLSQIMYNVSNNLTNICFFVSLIRSILRSHPRAYRKSLKLTMKSVCRTSTNVEWRRRLTGPFSEKSLRGIFSVFRVETINRASLCVRVF